MAGRLTEAQNAPDETSQKALAALESAILKSRIVPALALQENAGAAHRGLKPAVLGDALALQHIADAFGKRVGFTVEPGADPRLKGFSGVTRVAGAPNTICSTRTTIVRTGCPF